MTKNKLYTLLAIACFLGYAYLGFSAFMGFRQSTGFHPCIFRNVTSYPCPSCGTTRSVVAVFKGEWCAALMTNPLGIIVALAMIIIPVLLLYDTIRGTSVLFKLYRKTEQIVRIRWVAALLIVLLLANWIWNLNKPL